MKQNEQYKKFMDAICKERSEEYKNAIDAIKKNHITICTHDGIFHADECMACAILSITAETNIIRTRNESKFKFADILIDIGNGEYDHHQNDDTKIRENGVEYASAGLVWRDFGKYCILKYIKELPDIDISEGDIDYILNTIDNQLIQFIDKNDNGKLEDQFKSIPNISNIIHRMNNLDTSEIQHTNFDLAILICKKALTDYIREKLAVINAKKIIEESDTILDGKVLVLKQGAPWKNEVVTNEKYKDILYVIIPTDRNSYMLQCVPEGKNSYKNRKRLPIKWRGKTFKELVEVTNIDDVTFCHRMGHIVEAKSLDSIIKLADIAINEKSITKLVCVTYSSGTKIQYLYDDKHNLIRSENSRGIIKEYNYNENNKLIHVKDSDGNERWYEYDRNNNCIKIKHQDGREDLCDYNENNKIIHMRDANGCESWYEYDQNNNCIKIRHQDGREDWCDYNENNKIIHIKDSKGYERWYDYDRNGNTIHTEDSSGFEEWYEYEEI